MPNAIDVAQVFLKLARPEVGDVVTHLKLQKLLYYAQGFHLAMTDEPLFDEAILAWEHGPVVREVYIYYRGSGSSPLDMQPDFDPATVFTQEQLDIIVEVNQVYSQFSAWKLRDLTHDEMPWKSTKQSEEIGKEKLKAFFKTKIQPAD